LEKSFYIYDVRSR